MTKHIEYAQCPTCKSVFEKKTLYEICNVAPSDEMGCIHHLKEWLGSDELAEKIRVETFAQREKELNEIKNIDVFLAVDAWRRANNRKYVQSLYSENKDSLPYANHLFSYTLLKKSLDTSVTMIFFEIRENGMLLDIIDEDRFNIFSDTKDRIKKYAPQGIVDAYGPSSQITLISPGTYEDFKNLDKIVEGFNKRHSLRPPHRRLFAVGFDYNLAERPQKQLEKLHDKMRYTQNVEQITEGAARAS